MEMSAEQVIAASQEKIWTALNDTEILKDSMPGCDKFEAVGENAFEAQLTVKVGPVKAKFKFKVNLTDIDPPNGYTINGEGQGGAAGFARGSATVHLKPDGDNTILAYTVQANVGGKLAQLGSRLIDGAAKKIADEFFSNFIEIVAGEAEQEAVIDDEAAFSKPLESKSMPIWVWVTAVVVMGAMVLRVFA